MSSRVFVDTLFVIALINKRDQYHERAAELADQLEGQSLLVTDAVLLEIGNALARNFRQEAVEVIEEFFASEEVEIVRPDPDLFERAFDIYKRHQDKEWGLVDCASFVVMKEAAVSTALTFDQHFVQAGFAALMRDD